MKYYYDLHIHSALSPCADNDMTPENILLTAAERRLDIIAVADHNACDNLPAVFECKKKLEKNGKKMPMVIPAVEVETGEEVHVLCLFDDLEKTKDFCEKIKRSLLPIKNKPDFFGEQLIIDENNRIIGVEDQLLLTSSSITLSNLFDMVVDYGGVCIPAHVNNASYSLISNLGTIPSYLPINFIELSPEFNPSLSDAGIEMIKNYPQITCSDAHSLDAISKAEYYIELADENHEIEISDIVNLFKLKV